MGTAGQWIEVVVVAVFGGGAMLVWEAWGVSSSGNKERAFTFKNVLICALTGLQVGLWEAFHWRAFRWPLVLFSALAIAGFILVVKFYRPKAGDQGSKSSVPST